MHACKDTLSFTDAGEIPFRSAGSTAPFGKGRMGSALMLSLQSSCVLTEVLLGYRSVNICQHLITLHTFSAILST